MGSFLAAATSLLEISRFQLNLLLDSAIVPLKLPDDSVDRDHDDDAKGEDQG